MNQDKYKLTLINIATLIMALALIAGHVMKG